MFLLRPSTPYLPGVSFGATLFNDGCYFMVWAPNAMGLVIHFYTINEQKLGVVKLKERKGGRWLGFIEGVKEGMCYALEALGENDPARGLYFKDGRFLVDPYAKALNKAFIYDSYLYESQSETFIPKAIVVSQKDDFNWEGIHKPYIDRDRVILYEAHIKSLTQLNFKIPQQYRGTYLGFCHESVIAHLKRLGITAVQIMPVAAAMTEPSVVERGLVNYWGYNPVCFMAPDPRYAYEPKNVIKEFKSMVKELHRNNIAVILDVVFNHTAEGDINGPVLCYKGFDAIGYYAYERVDGKRNLSSYLNYTGCGNTFDCDNKVSLRLIYETLRYWVEYMQVDGFRFDLGVTPAREDRNGSFEFNRKSGFFKLFACDVYLNSSLLIGEPWDLGPNGYRLGGYPTGWSEQNDKFRDTVRRFWRGDEGVTADFATRIMGSRDVFAKTYRSINASVNYVTYHDGFTLEDLVSYKSKHNELNGENNNDGTVENFSSNQGVEGSTDDRQILAKRAQLKRNLIATVIISQGIPHILSGDEFSKTQYGNNNSYCQDNDINYINWNITQEQDDFIKYISLLCRLRTNSRALSELNLDDDNYHLFERNYIVRWRLPNGDSVSTSDWQNPKFNTFMLYIGDKDINKERWCFLFNPGNDEVFFTLPITPSNKEWALVLDSSQQDGHPSAYEKSNGFIEEVAPFSLKILCMQTPKDVHEEFNTSADLLRHINRVTWLKYRKD